MLSEFLKSNIAKELHLNNYPSFTVICHLQAVCIHVLEPIVEQFGAHLHILAGYQCPEITSELGLHADSQHLFGEAVDFAVELPDTKEPIEGLLQVFGWMCDHSPYDELYLEEIQLPENQRRRRSRALMRDPRYLHWIHVSYRSGGINRHQRNSPQPR